MYDKRLRNVSSNARIWNEQMNGDLDADVKWIFYDSEVGWEI